jgi:predicted Fe-Mo cluster-binding NifX family protein
MEVNKMTTIAIPSMTDGGLESDICAHFGSCEYFTIVKIEGGKIEGVGAISNAPPTGEHNCAAPATLLKTNNVDAVLVSGIGGRPLMSLASQGIRVFGGAFGRVCDAVDGYNDGSLTELSDRGTCNCSHH